MTVEDACNLKSGHEDSTKQQERAGVINPRKNQIANNLLSNNI